LVAGGEITGVWAWPAACGDFPTDWLIPAGDTVEEISWASFMPLGSWVLNVRFNYAGEMDSTSFSVVAEYFDYDE
jgi:hypothetical protein